AVLDLLYEASSGELRYILNRCTDLLVRTMIEFPTSRELSLDLARPLLRRMTMSTIDRCNLTQKQKTLLVKLVADGPCQPKEFKQYGFQSVPAFLRYLLRFYELGLVDRRRSGSEVVYTPRGDAILALEGLKA
ncbi:MAG: MarR family winged helix-turn-helix transcriptional regulator, partial [Thermoplasmata archaeon]